MKTIAMVVVLLACPMLCWGGANMRSGEERGFWEHKGVLVGKMLSVDCDGYVRKMEIQVLGVVVTDTWMPSRFVLEMPCNSSTRWTGLLDPSVGETWLLCLGHDGEKWHVLLNPSPLLGGDAFARRLTPPFDDELSALIRHILEARKISLSKDR